MLFAVDFAAQLGDMVFLVDEARGGIVDSEIQLAMSFPVSDKAEGEFALDEAVGDEFGNGTERTCQSPRLMSA